MSTIHIIPIEFGRSACVALPDDLTAADMACVVAALQAMITKPATKEQAVRDEERIRAIEDLNT